jgi:hypothetical protein
MPGETRRADREPDEESLLQLLRTAARLAERAARVAAFCADPRLREDADWLADRIAQLVRAEGRERLGSTPEAPRGAGPRR